MENEHTPEQLQRRFMANFLAEMRRQRVARKWTRADLSTRTRGQISATTLAGYESGHRNMRLESAWVLATAFDMRLTMLVDRAEGRTLAGQTLLDMHSLMTSSSEQLAPVRLWATMVHPSAPEPGATLELTDGALAALCILMRTDRPTGLSILQPFLV